MPHSRPSAGDGENDVLREVANRIERDAREMRAPVDADALWRKRITGDIGMPVYLARLCQRAGIHHVRAVEVGGRGVLTADGWLSSEELVQMVREFGTGYDEGEWHE